MSTAAHALVEQAPTLARQAAPRRCACGGLIGADGLCAKCRSRPLALRRSPARAAPRTAPAIVHEVVRSPGRALDAPVREAVEARLGHGFGRVRVHTDDRAAESAVAVGATAYSVGNHIVFGPGAYSPLSTSGQRLLSHELVHTLQHGSGPAGVPDRLQIGRIDDEAEREAERLASSSPEPRGAPVATRPAALRRVPATPQTVAERRSATLPRERRGEETVRVHVTRSFSPCPCASVADEREGVFYNPDLDNLAIAYRHCRGRRTTDVYARLESVASSFFAGTPPQAGTGTLGIDVNVVGRVVGGRVVVEAVGTQVGGAGIGGRAQIVFQGGQWRVFLEPQFIHRLSTAGGADANELQVSLGGRLGPVSGRVDMRDLLDPTLRSVRGTACLSGPGGTSVCLVGEAAPGGGLTGGVQVGGTIGGAEVRQKEDCYQCLCPPPARVYTCIEDVLPRTEPHFEDVAVPREEELRVYFSYDATAPSEEPALRTASNTALGTAVSRISAGGAATFIVGYASPEGNERHNDPLSLRRAAVLRAQLTGRLGPSVALPEATGGGELLGRRPQPTASSRLGDLIHPMGFRSAEDLSVLLLGDEIARPELRRQFISLFTALDAAADRLALFGLTPSDPIAADVLATVDEFLRSRGGTRPWERVFRLLRYAAVRVRRTVIERQPSPIEHPGSVSELSDDDCRPHAQAAERAGLFGPIDPDALKPTTRASDRELDCRYGPEPVDVRRGCRYLLPPSARRRATAPDLAPWELNP
jgi:hypothetical protein